MPTVQVVCFLLQALLCMVCFYVVCQDRTLHSGTTGAWQTHVRVADVNCADICASCTAAALSMPEDMFYDNQNFDVNQQTTTAEFSEHELFAGGLLMRTSNAVPCEDTAMVAGQRALSCID